jgi:uncharacterized OB-fold protein
MTRFPDRPGRIVPASGGLDGEFYRRAAETGRLHFQRCDRCGAWRHPPRHRCARCGSDAWTWRPASGRGRVFTWTVTHRPVDPAFAAELPYAVVVAEMEEGVRLVGTLLDLPPAALALDLPVEAVLEQVSGTVALTHFRPT